MSFLFLKPSESILEKVPYALRDNPDLDDLKSWLRQKRKNAVIFISITFALGLLFSILGILGEGLIGASSVGLFFLAFSLMKARTVQKAQVSEEEVRGFVRKHTASGNS